MQPYQRWTNKQLAAEAGKLRKMRKSTASSEEEKHYEQELIKIAAEIKRRVNEHDNK